MAFFSLQGVHRFWTINTSFCLMLNVEMPDYSTPPPSPTTICGVPWIHLFKFTQEMGAKSVPALCSSPPSILKHIIRSTEKIKQKVLYHIKHINLHSKVVEVLHDQSPCVWCKQVVRITADISFKIASKDDTNP
jgi:hypothetical protein